MPEWPPPMSRPESGPAWTSNSREGRQSPARDAVHRVAKRQRQRDAKSLNVASQLHFGKAAIRALQEENQRLQSQQAALSALDESSAHMSSFLCLNDIRITVSRSTGPGAVHVLGSAAGAAAAAAAAQGASNGLHRTVLPSASVGGNPHHAGAAQLFDVAWTGLVPPRELFAAFVRISPRFFAELDRANRARMRATLRALAAAEGAEARGALLAGVGQVIAVREQLRRYATIHAPMFTVTLWQAQTRASPADVLARQEKQGRAVEALGLTPSQAAGVAQAWEAFGAQMAATQAAQSCAVQEVVGDLPGGGGGAAEGASLRGRAEAALAAEAQLEALKSPAARRVLVYDGLVSAVIACLTWQQTLVLAVMMDPYSADYTELCPQLVARYGVAGDAVASSGGAAASE